LFRYIGSSGDSELAFSLESISRRKEQVKVRQTLSDRDKRSQKHVQVSKSARFKSINKLRSLPAPVLEKGETQQQQDFSFIELVTPEQTKVINKKPQVTIILDERPRPIISTKEKEKEKEKEKREVEEVTDYYFLDTDGFQNFDEVKDATVVPVESFEVDEDSLFVHEYDGDSSDSERSSEGECDYPDTPNEDSLEENWGVGKLHSSDSEGDRGNSSSDDEGGFRHGYYQNESQEEYDEYI